MTPFVKREWYTIAIPGMVVRASFLPISGEPVRAFSVGTQAAVALLFFCTAPICLVTWCWPA